MTQQRKKNRNVEVYNPYKQLQNEGFDFYNFNSNDIPKYYTVRLNDTDKLISKKLKWRKKKKRETYKACFRDMDAVIYYDRISDEYFLSNTRYANVLNYLYKNYDRNQINAYWPITFDRYFKDDVGQRLVIVHYNNYDRLTPTPKVQVILYVQDGKCKFLSRKNVFVKASFH